ncbi:dTDP-4-dehydrorhamnose reductase [Provencibacterium massiliense]|uniref:dTDP-4-dehydrorhamnose reductase n=1 Tax=Provencibacterium massiliense TaxID=1841868 RepID=UPI0009A7CCEA|nr:dTDP-4-dehydrorhamnose reductase [Provencibacterium massiliense]
MRILITGITGQLGMELFNQLCSGSSSIGPIPSCYQEAEIIAPKHSEVDITNYAAIQNLFKESRPELVFHCAAMTAVDACEEQKDVAMDINAEATKIISQECDAIGAKLVYISTDYVFDGKKKSPYIETDTCNPCNVYGLSKYQGEVFASSYCSRLFIVRTSWLYSKYHRNFVRSILNKGRTEKQWSVVDDQIGSPTNAEDLAFHILKLAATNHFGIYHCTGDGVCTWFEFAQKILEFSGYSANVLPCKSDEFPSKAIRPANSVLNHEKLKGVVGDEMRPWQTALRDCLIKMEHEPKRVLVTGAGGYIGRHVVKALLDMGHHVMAAAYHAERVDSAAQVISSEIFSGDPEVYRIFGSPDVLIHLAWQDGFIHNSDAHMGNLPLHLRFLRDMIVGGVAQVAVMGTMHEIGYWEGEVNDNTPTNPLSFYGIAKNSLRQCMSVLSSQYPNTVFQWLRAFYIYGDDRYSNSIFAKIVAAVEQGQSKFPFNTGTNRYDFISVEELGRQIAAAATQKQISGIINCCSGKDVSLRDQVEQFIEYNGLPISLEYGAFPNRKYDSPCIWGNADKINSIMRNLEKDRARH